LPQREYGARRLVHYVVRRRHNHIGGQGDGAIEDLTGRLADVDRDFDADSASVAA
jgi:hypothetical protein